MGKVFFNADEKTHKWLKLTAVKEHTTIDSLVLEAVLLAKLWTFKAERKKQKERELIEIDKDIAEAQERIDKIHKERYRIWAEKMARARLRKKRERRIARMKGWDGTKLFKSKAE